jgi:hypothetical protein
MQGLAGRVRADLLIDSKQPQASKKEGEPITAIAGFFTCH